MILHGMVDIAGQAYYSVKGLKEEGIDAKLIVYKKNLYQYGEDESFEFSDSFIMQPIRALKMFLFGIKAMFKYDTFHFHFGYTLFPFSLDLFWLKVLRKNIYMEYHGDDIRWILYREKPKYYPLSNIVPRNNRSVRRVRRTIKNVSHFILHDDELTKHLSIKKDRINYIPLRAEVRNISPYYPSLSQSRPLIVHASTNHLMKGSKFILNAVNSLKQQYEFDFIMIENKTHDEAMRIYEKADIVIDQLFAQTYGVFAIEAMALGKPVISYISDEIKKTFPDELPIVSANIENIEEKIKYLLDNPKERNRRGMLGRQYVENYHDYVNIGKALEKMYEGKYNEHDTKAAFKYIKMIKDTEK